ncbi:MAG: hypothetical protein DCF16_00610 [Alphaproteobacteria bacterium]|nr:MAG: hypothetical protein DCF16_00610 [Alphaproteobacteria bacterium]
MAEIRETHVERDANGNVVDTKVVERRKGGGGFGWGMLFAVLVIAGGIIAFAYSQGSFQNAGAEADRAAEQVETQTEGAVENAGDAIENAGDQVERATN